MFDSTRDTPEFADSGNASAEASREAAQRIVRHTLESSYSIYRGFAFRRLRNAVDADEVTQTFALKALERAAQLRDPRAVRGWLRRLFETTLIDHCRRCTSRRAREIAFEIDIHDRGGTRTSGDMEDAGRLLAATLPLLRREYSDIICRLDLLDQAKPEAATQLGITVNNLTVRLHRARRALRAALDQAPIAIADAPDLALAA